MFYNYLFLLGKIILGGYFIMNGINHFTKTSMMAGYAASRGVKAGKIGVQVTGGMLLLGGIGVLLGAFVQVAIGLLILFLLLASFGIHHYWTDTDPGQKMSERVNFLKNLALIGTLLMLLSLPYWPFSLY